MSGMWEEVQRPAKHDPVPIEKPFGINRKDLVAAGLRGVRDRPQAIAKAVQLGL